jgi:hypothetical protein
MGRKLYNSTTGTYYSHIEYGVEVVPLSASEATSWGITDPLNVVLASRGAIAWKPNAIYRGRDLILGLAPERFLMSSLQDANANHFGIMDQNGVLNPQPANQPNGSFRYLKLEDTGQTAYGRHYNVFSILLGDLDPSEFIERLMANENEEISRRLESGVWPDATGLPPKLGVSPVILQRGASGLGDFKFPPSPFLEGQSDGGGLHFSGLVGFSDYALEMDLLNKNENDLSPTNHRFFKAWGKYIGDGEIRPFSEPDLPLEDCLQALVQASHLNRNTYQSIDESDYKYMLSFFEVGDYVYGPERLPSIEVAGDLPAVHTCPSPTTIVEKTPMNWWIPAITGGVGLAFGALLAGGKEPEHEEDQNEHIR